MSKKECPIKKEKNENFYSKKTQKSSKNKNFQDNIRLKKIFLINIIRYLLNYL